MTWQTRGPSSQAPSPSWPHQPSVGVPRAFGGTPCPLGKVLGGFAPLTTLYLKICPAIAFEGMLSHELHLHTTAGDTESCPAIASTVLCEKLLSSAVNVPFKMASSVHDVCKHNIRTIGFPVVTVLGSLCLDKGPRLTWRLKPRVYLRARLPISGTSLTSCCVSRFTASGSSQH